MKIVVGEGSCGIAAGAAKVYSAIEGLIGSTASTLTVTGCIGMCFLEPIVDIYDNGELKKRLVKVQPEDAEKIIAYANGDESAVNDIEISEDGVSFSILLRGLEEMPVHMHLTGMFNVYNALAAASLAMILGIDQQAIREGLESVVNVPGRVEMLDTKTPYKVILDYSHSPDALENILTTVRTFTRSRLIVLFGCGGDRDHGKRPIMGEIAGRLADFSILTSDNPRTEDPNAILASIEEGIKPTGGKYVIIENRRDAIRHALEMGRDGDVIILAGKGHETYQDIMGVKRPFDEKVVVQELLRELQPESESSEE